MQQNNKKINIISFRVPDAVSQALDAYLARLHHPIPGASFNRSDAARDIIIKYLIQEGIVEVESD